MPDHDIEKFADGLSSKLSARSRHVCAFLGAGTSAACGLPDVAKLEELVTKGLRGEQRKAFEKQLRGRNLEQALSRIRRIEVLLNDGTGKVDGLSGETASALDRQVCKLIVKHLKVADANLTPMLQFAVWAAQANYDEPLELFTVNYDLLLETALEQLGVPYFDGFVGFLRARFQTDLVEGTPTEPGNWMPSFLVRLWKLHGSVNWEWDEGSRSEVVRLGVPVQTDHPAAIYPSDTKYDDSRRVPFVVLQDRLRRALQVPETLVLVAGYSWSDEHFNDLLFGAAKRKPRTDFLCLAFDDLPPSLADRAPSLPNVQAVASSEAILGGIRAQWAEPKSDLPDVWGDDKCLLVDFRHLATFLSHSASRHSDIEQRLAESIAKLAAASA
jgi:hypothetical protein